jgi:GDP-4-dehydro-6-deoxy-D-mannose reductase
MKKALIFGIGGFVGKYLSAELIENRYCVEGADLHRTASVPADIDFFACNILDADAVSQLIHDRKPDCIINLAAISSVGVSWKMPGMTMSVNVNGALNILEAAKGLAVRPRVLFIGSSEEYRSSEHAMSEETPLEANNPYGISKMTQERFAELYRNRYGMKVFYVRPFNHTGPGQRDDFVLPSFCQQTAKIELTKKPGVIHVGNLKAKRDFSDVRDIVRAYRMVLESEDSSKIYNIGSGSAYSLEELLKYIVSLSTQKIEIAVDSDKLRPADTPMILCNHDKIEKELGWKPKYSIFETLKELYQYYLQQK